MSLDLAWEVLDRAGWDEALARAGRSSILQCWAWGEAKRDEGWRPCRAVIRSRGEIVGLAQVLETRVGGIGRVARLNRGPVWLRPMPTDATVQALRLIARNWRWWNAGALFFAPELGEAEAGAVPFRKRNGSPWRSAWVDLSEEPEVLRKRLDGKWRNMLVGAEKAGLSLEVSNELDWLMDRYEGLMRDKSFTGTPPVLIRALAAHAPGDCLVLRAVTPDGDAVGGILVVRHGAAATYLVGWNGDAGRQLKANNFLLWQAVLALRARGLRWFDLGGIDDVLTPGIAVFKRGMRGAEYTLVGEYLAF